MSDFMKLLSAVAPEACGLALLVAGHGPGALLLSPLLIRVAWLAAELVHGGGHTVVRALVDRDGAALRLEHLLEHRSPQQLLRGLLPLAPIGPACWRGQPQPWLAAGDLTPWKLRLKAAAGLAAHGVVVAAALVVLLQPALTAPLPLWLRQLLLALVASNLAVACCSRSDLVSLISGRGAVLCCGNFGVLAAIDGANPDDLLPPAAIALFERMGRETELRGAQAGGGLVMAIDDHGDACFVGHRIVNAKRGDLTPALEAAFRRRRRRALRRGRRLHPAGLLACWHYRFGTSGPPAVRETHWQEWCPARLAYRWRQNDDGRWQGAWGTVHHRITHNGDFETLEAFGRGLDVAFDLSPWLEQALHQPAPAVVDSARIAGMMDLLICQGDCFAAVRWSALISLVTFPATPPRRTPRDRHRGSHNRQALETLGQLLITKAAHLLQKETLLRQGGLDDSLARSRHVDLLLSHSSRTFPSRQVMEVADLMARRGAIRELFTLTGEPATASVAAMHHTPTHLLFGLCRQLLQAFPDERTPPLGLRLRRRDLLLLHEHDLLLGVDSSEIVGSDSNGQPRPSTTSRQLARAGRQGAQHVLETPLAWLLHAVYILVSVAFGLPLVQTLPPWDTLAGAVLREGALIADVGFYVFGPWCWTLALRACQRRPLLARTGRRSLVVGETAWVHPLLTNYISKLFSLSFGITSLDVQGGEVGDHLLHTHAHRLVRGTLLFFGIPDGRFNGWLRAEADAALLTARQSDGIRHWETGPEIVAVGTEPALQRGPFRQVFVLPSLAADSTAMADTPARHLIETLRESRFGAYRRLLASDDGGAGVGGPAGPVRTRRDRRPRPRQPGQEGNRAERLCLWGDQRSSAVLPSTQVPTPLLHSRFQNGASCLSASSSSWQQRWAVPRWSASTATTTIASPLSTSPTRWRTITAVTPWRRAQLTASRCSCVSVMPG
jgi:hypothetical protein